MTRWARAGSTQKHKKMPEDPTPWEEFASQRKSLVKNEKFVGNKVTKISNEAAETSLKKKLKERLKRIKLQTKQHSSLVIADDSNDASLTSAQNGLDAQGDGFKKHSELEISGEKNKKKKVFGFQSKGVEETDAPLKRKKIKTGKKKLKNIAVKTSVSSDSEDLNADEMNLVESHKNKYKNSKKKYTGLESEDRMLLEGSENEETEMPSDSENKEDRKTADLGSSASVAKSESSPNNSKQCAAQRKKKSFFERVKETRARNGILLLPKDVETRLYRLKTALRAKGLSGEQIKKMLREARRKAELKYRKTLKTCFNCREFGHVLANCPKLAEDNEQGTGICFKCGSTEHVSFRCHIKTSDFPYAKCFICHNSGHLSRNCPENKHGVYPKGGQCNLCGSIYHLRKDCPKSSQKKNGEETEITAHTMNEFRSVDDEIEEVESRPVKQKKPKVVKF